MSAGTVKAPKAVKSGNPRKRAAGGGRITVPPKLTTPQDLKRKGKATDTVRIVLDDDLANAVDDAARALDLAYKTEAPAAVITERTTVLQTARKAAEAETIVLNLQALGRKAYRDLEAEFPATEAQNAEYREATKDPDDPTSEGQPAPYDVDRFAPALIAATVTAPKMDADEWEAELDENWTENEYLLLWTAVISVNNKTRIDIWGKG